MRNLIHELAVAGLPPLVVKLVELPNLVRNTTVNVLENGSQISVEERFVVVELAAGKLCGASISFGVYLDPSICFSSSPMRV